MARHYLFTSESVTEGHPDKNLRPDFRRGAGRHFGAGSQRPRGLRDHGLHRPGAHHGRDHHQLLCGHRQASPGRSSGTSATTGPSTALTATPAASSPTSTSSPATSPWAWTRRWRPRRARTRSCSNGAGDQGMMFGYACDETPELMPLPISLAHKLARAPDGGAQGRDSCPTCGRTARPRSPWSMTDDRPVRVDTVVLSTQHSPEVTLEQIRKDMIEHGDSARDSRGAAG